MMRWEYKIIARSRGLVREGGLGVGQIVAGEFNPDGAAMMAQLQQLGNDGWELVAITPRNSAHQSRITTDEIWVFKRPVS